MFQFDHANTFIMDRNCSSSPQARTLPQLKSIRTWAIDKFHGRNHAKTRACSPYNRPAIMRRLRGVNTSVCEQVWSWFRGYAKALNSANPLRRKLFGDPLF